jgi:ferritin-like metal-binding protein YciE
MSTPESLQDIFADELKDLWSANDQMAKSVKALAERAHDPKLKQTLESSYKGINKHADTLKTLLAESDEEVKPEHCKGMAGLVSEAEKHTTKEAPKDGELLDIVILSQYQRMCHYGISGFGAAASYAKALGKKEHEATLKAVVADIYKADEYASKLGDKTAKAALKAA